MTDVEQRIHLLEQLHHDNSKALVAMQSDIHHMTKTFDKMQETLESLANVTVKIETIGDSARRAHERVDALTHETQSIKLHIAQHSWLTKVGERVLITGVLAIVTSILGYFFLFAG